MTAFNESVVEQAALAWLGALGYRALPAATLGPDAPDAERETFREVLLRRRLREALARLNPTIPPPALDEALRQLVLLDGPTLERRNHRFHRLLTEGVTVEFRRPDGSIAGAQLRVLDFDDPAANDWLAVNQLTVIENRHKRRLDVVLFVNGLPLAVLELKNAASEKATIWDAFHQLQTYKGELPTLFAYNEALVISDGVQARLGSLTADRERFMPWRTTTGELLAAASLPELQVLIEGIFEPRRFLDLLRHFVTFEEGERGQLAKKVAGYHQFHAVNLALAETLRASAPPDGVRELGGPYGSQAQPGGESGDQRVGIVWHTQGSGKSLTMLFYAGRVVLHPAMANPTLVVLTDRNDLDDQLFGTFARGHELLRQPPVQAASRADLRDRLRVEAGGVVFSTIQKFLPSGNDREPLSERRNIVVIADEAHRSQYDFVDGFARHLHEALPHASFIGFTGTPIELTDRNTRAVFGDYISIYDVRQAVADGATVPIYYESRLARLALDEQERPHIDPEFEEVTEGEEVEAKERLKSRWAQLEAIVGSDKRLTLVAEDLVRHFEQRQEALEGKAMVVCMSRRLCVALYNQIVALRPSWHHADDDKGLIKVVMTGSASDPTDWQPHIRSKAGREALAERFRDPSDPLQMVLVRDMWLTGFDVPSLHTMYVDKPMRGHNLMQAIARVNRVFRDKPGGLIVDFIGLADQLRQAVATYTESGGTGQTALNQAQAVRLLLEKHDIVRALFHGFDWRAWQGHDPAARLALLPAAQEHILAQRDGKERLLSAVLQLSQAFALAAPHPEALQRRDDVAFFQAVRAALAKTSRSEREASGAHEQAIRQLVSRAIAPDAVTDIFAAAGLRKPDLSILSEEFLADVRGLPQRNLAVELLRTLLSDEIRQRRTRNVVQARSFEQLLEASIRRYSNRVVETAQVIEELIALARDIQAAEARGEHLGLSDEELAFYDALGANDSAIQRLGDETLRQLARELVAMVRRNVTLDWTVRENVRAKLRVLVKRLLRQYGYPPDKQEQATQTVLEQAEVLTHEWASP